jgi:hypothetical protein
MEEQENLRAGVTPEREAEVLAAWHRANGSTPRRIGIDSQA